MKKQTLAKIRAILPCQLLSSLGSKLVPSISFFYISSPCHSTFPLPASACSAAAVASHPATMTYFHCDLPVAVCSPPTLAVVLPVAVCSPPTLAVVLPVAVCSPPTLAVVLPVAVCSPPTLAVVLPVAVCSPPTLAVVLPVAVCSPPTLAVVLPVAVCSPPTLAVVLPVAVCSPPTLAVVLPAYSIRLQQEQEWSRSGWNLHGSTW